MLPCLALDSEIPPVAVALPSATDKSFVAVLHVTHRAQTLFPPRFCDCLLRFVYRLWAPVGEFPECNAISPLLRSLVR